MEIKNKTKDSYILFVSRYGTLEECTLMKFNDTGRSRGFAFLTYEKEYILSCTKMRSSLTR